MQSCNNCHRAFSWREIYKSFWGVVYKSIVCKRCGMKHKITIPGRFVFVALISLPMTIFVNFLTPFTHFGATLGAGIVLSIISSLFTPYFVRFKIAEERGKIL